MNILKNVNNLRILHIYSQKKIFSHLFVRLIKNQPYLQQLAINTIFKGDSIEDIVKAILECKDLIYLNITLETHKQFRPFNLYLDNGCM